MSETNQFNDEPPAPTSLKNLPVALLIPGANEPDTDAKSPKPQKPKNALERFNRAEEKRLDLPRPEHILRRPTRTLVEAYGAVRAPLDRYWSLLGNAAEEETRAEGDPA